MNNNQDVQKKIKELRKLAKEQNLLGFDVDAYIIKALDQMGIEEF